MTTTVIVGDRRVTRVADDHYEIRSDTDGVVNVRGPLARRLTAYSLHMDESVLAALFAEADADG